SSFILSTDFLSNILSFLIRSLCLFMIHISFQSLRRVWVEGGESDAWKDYRLFQKNACGACNLRTVVELGWGQRSRLADYAVAIWEQQHTQL
ncbi:MULTISPECIES: hypothetical protein, partial [unclassified Pseudomonas]